MVNNAVDAMLEHSNEGDLWVRTGAEGDKLFIEFTDSGPGVKDASRVFDPFYTTKPVGKGTGLGLSICYGIVTEHGGSIRVRNVPPRGASFTIEVPYQPSKSPKQVKDPDAGQALAQSREGRILLIDQDESVLEAVRAILRERDHEVETTRSAADAMALLEKQEFDLVVADLDLSGTAGSKYTSRLDPCAQAGLGEEVCLDARGHATWVSPGRKLDTTGTTFFRNRLRRRNC